MAPVFECGDLDANMIVDIASATIAGAALILTVYEMRTTQKHNQLSVKPHLQFNNKIDEILSEGLTWKLTLQNNGLGPAIFKKLTFYFDGQPFTPETNDPIRELVQKKFSKQPFFIKTSSRPGIDCAMKAQDEFVLGIIEPPGVGLNDMGRLKSLPAIELFISYECFYGNTFTLDSRGKPDLTDTGLKA